MMRGASRVAAALLIIAAVIGPACFLPGCDGSVKVVERDGGVIVETPECFSALLRTGDARGLYREATCADDAPLWDALASDHALARRVFNGVDRLYLGNTAFAAGPFRLCDLLARLTRDERWTTDIDSLGAAVALARILPQTALTAPASVALTAAGKTLDSVALEYVLLGQSSGATGCPTAPDKIPTAANIDIALAASSQP